MVLFAQSYLHADRRYYVWTYQYATMEKGSGEIEGYTTYKILDQDSLRNNVITELQLELEVGMNNNFDASIYQVFEQDPGFPLQYKGYKIRTRYRFGEKGMYFVDPLIYLEYKGVPDFSSHAFEGKLILAKDLGEWNLAVNPIIEYEKAGEDKELNWAYAIGLSYGFSSILRLGIEIKGSKMGHYIGPVISHGKDNLWATLGGVLKLSSVKEGKPDAEIRLLVGIHSFKPLHR